MKNKNNTVKIVGCGLSGIVAANILKKNGYNVIIFEKRSHIGGNCYDKLLDGVLYHVYGPHIFHTDDKEVFNYLSQYTEWLPFKLQPMGRTNIGLISLPYSKKTIKEIGRELTQEEIIKYIFKDYSEKQWGVSIDKIPKSIISRIPKTKDCDDPTWFEGQMYQCIPKLGYTVMFEKMLKDINVVLSSSDKDWKETPSEYTIYTGRIDEYFNHLYGNLPYRSLKFEHEVTNKKMPYCIENQNNREVEFTRKYDHSFFNYKKTDKTVITKEYPIECKEGDIPYYPIPFGSGYSIYQKYKELADKEGNTLFLGRLATYKYLDMWVAIRQTINIIRSKFKIFTI